MFLFRVSVSKQEASKIEKVTSEHEAYMHLQEQKQNKLKEQLKSARDKVTKERTKLREQLKIASDQVTEERMKWQQKQDEMREELDASPTVFMGRRGSDGTPLGSKLSRHKQKRPR